MDEPVEVVETLRIVIQVMPDGQMKMQSNVPNLTTAVGMLEMAKNAFLNPPKQNEATRIVQARAGLQINGKPL